MIKLSLQGKLVVYPTAPFNFDATFHKPDHFTSGDNFWQPGIRWQTWNWKGVPLGIKFTCLGTVAKPQVKIELFAARKLTGDFVESLLAEIRYLYNFDLNLAPFYKEAQKDPVLALAIRRLRGMRPGHPSCLYEYLIIGVVLQNATVRRSIAMFRSLLESYGSKVEFDGKKLWCFWSPGELKNVSEEELRALKLGYRAKFIKKIDEQFAAGVTDEKTLRAKDAVTQKAELLKIYGVGPATVWYLLFDVFHHFDIFDHVSPWEQKIYSKIFFDRDPEDPVPVEKILKYFERFGRYKHLAVHYAWEDLWWRHKRKPISWLAKEVRV